MVGERGGADLLHGPASGHDAARLLSGFTRLRRMYALMSLSVNRSSPNGLAVILIARRSPLATSRDMVRVVMPSRSQTSVEVSNFSGTFQSLP